MQAAERIRVVRSDLVVCEPRLFTVIMLSGITTSSESDLPNAYNTFTYITSKQNKRCTCIHSFIPPPTHESLSIPRTYCCHWSQLHHFGITDHTQAQTTRCWCLIIMTMYICSCPIQSITAGPIGSLAIVFVAALHLKL